MQPFGGPGKIVEIDESKFGRRKYNRGHKVEGQWVFGGVERGSNKCFFVPVEKRDAGTLIPLLKKHVLPGTTIMSDGWRAYSSLKQNGYTHLVVNHSVEFKNSVTGACTNTVESFWRHIKTRLPHYRRQKNYFGGYLAHYMFIKTCGAQNIDPLQEFFQAASRMSALGETLVANLHDGEVEDDEENEEEDGEGDGEDDDEENGD